MKKAVVALSILLSFLVLSQTAGVALAEDEDNGETHGESDDMTALIVMGFSRKGRKA
jgi:hypothetical protein